jgi:ribosomal protein S18 acetylase RimI-like enzyme
MTAEEYVAWLPRHEREYAENMIDFGGVEREAAHAKAAKDFERLLGDGLDTAGNSLYVVDDDGVPAGSLWLAERDDEQGAFLFVYDVNVDESRRGRGLGRAAMVFAEEEARRREIPRLILNVFGGNEIARNLYRSLGYDEMAVWMVKRV